MSSPPLALDKLPRLSELFRWFNNGKHLNRESEPVLWLELEQQETAYRELFTALGYDLRIDRRGFAWFHSEESSSNVNKSTHQLALLFMVIFDAQANGGKPLGRFNDWVIDRSLLNTVFEQHQDLLITEGLDVETMLTLLEKTASRYGFARAEGGHWQLLPAAHRYLDHFLALNSEVDDDSFNGSGETQDTDEETLTP